MGQQRIPPESVAWGEPPDRERRPPLRIRRPRPDRPVRGIVLSQEMVYVGTHYVDGRTIPHVIPVESCRGCQANNPARGAGYLAIWDDDFREVTLAEITDRAIRYTPGLIQNRGNLRGRRILLVRSGGSMRSKVNCRLDEPQPVHDRWPLPTTEAIRSQLCHIWGAGDRPADDQADDQADAIPV